eukprot:2182568-Ditylum_brightwellii.AAC.1
MMEDSGMECLVTHAKYRGEFGSMVRSSSVLCVDGFGDIILGCTDAIATSMTKSTSLHMSKCTELMREVVPLNLAYMIYTSGTTGKPKAV